ncbi:LPS export ABC transporter ATP-binding protein [Lyticum sinuosum]|uniref:LPS export ABC transporter ATP-binding protein n=1 Tax=Lyticum sinuosum TaxID=1332059 RepID=A0AAE4VK76_9RICK|nr:LPS export ABC transporter ATP-binding protein [Lyticum sinuosum]MDZ5761500.1 putative LPS export ABC transporter ATP-binding protein [Lyticum sinuosum]
MLIANNLTKIEGNKIIINSCSFKVSKREIVGIFGPNGAGKTTSFYIIAGLIFPNSGTIRLDNKDITKLDLAQRAKCGIAYLSQESSIFEDITVYDNIMIPLEINNHPKKNRDQKVNEIMQQMKINHLSNVKGRLLSGGERRRVEIARCWTLNPSYILLDEPTTGLDPITVEDLRIFIKKLALMGTGIMITDHNVKDIIPIVDRAYVMYKGEVIAQGNSDNIKNDDFVKKIYLGN